MAITAEDALQRLGTIADVVLAHDRPIVRPVDDSVGRVISGGLQILRRARGLCAVADPTAPRIATILAVGGPPEEHRRAELGSAVS